ncbi:MAG: hypothetical protein IJU72_01040, partial [Bacteroidales bacterium]|nr:hypothetical protein [Bacteroidales bacterium]
VKYLIYSMNALKPATATTACAGIRRMEFSQPLPSSLGTAGAHGHLAGMRGRRTGERRGGQTAAWAGKNSQPEGSALHGASARREHGPRWPAMLMAGKHVEQEGRVKTKGMLGRPQPQKVEPV